MCALSLSEPFHFFSDFRFLAKGYLKKLEQDPDATILLGDSAYNRSKLKRELGLGLPVPLPGNGTQQKVRI